MKSLIVLLALIVSTSAFAEVFNYQSFYDEEGTDPLDFTVSVELTGGFNKNSQVASVRVFAEKTPGKIIQLFEFKGSEIKVKWTNGTLRMYSTKNVKPLIKSEYYNPAHSDSGINRESEYSFEVTLNETDAEDFFVDDQGAGEMALSSYLRKI